MRSDIRRMSNIAAMLFLVLGLAGISQATTPTTGYAGGNPWQVGDVIICFGSGTCNVLRIVAGTPVLIDQIFDANPPNNVATPGDTRGVAINNTLHVVVTDNGGGSQSNVVVYTIASVNPNAANPNAPIPHTVLSNFNGSGGAVSNNAQAVAVDQAGDMFIGNAGNGGAPSIVELSVTGALLGTFSVPPACASTLVSLDVSADGNSVFFTAGDGTIRQVSMPLSSALNCTAIPITQPTISGNVNSTQYWFVGDSPSISAYGIRVLPSGSLPANCSSAVATYWEGHGLSPNTSCPNGGFLVVATGTVLFDFDVNDEDWPDDANSPDPNDDTADICTLQAPNGSTSCALLLDNWGHIVARYPITTTSGLRALALDPLVTDCTNNANCSPSYTPAPKVNNFWLGDSASSSFYEVDFATGTPFPFDANANQSGVCSSPLCTSVTGIQGIGIYGGEGANQAGLVKLLPNNTDITLLANNTASVGFLENFMNVTLYCPSSPNSICSQGEGIPVALWASVINEVSCFNDQIPALPCRQTTSISRNAEHPEGLVWKIDIPQGNIGTTLPSGAIVAHKHFTNFISPDAPQQPIDNGTDVFTDMFYDTTNLVGNNDPSSPKKSVQTLHEVVAQTTSGGGSVSNSGCFYVLPTPNGACFPA
ncbi:MAG TPA: hypothetical protein VEI01_08765, partial [Terriglobales bacterium]|nr:hypothetical protein [Terriglobales bacterium]